MTEEMQESDRRMRGELIGFIHEGMLESRRPVKHGPDSRVLTARR